MIRTIFFDIGNVLLGFNHDLIWQRLAVFSALPVERLAQDIRDSGLMNLHETGRLASRQFFDEVQRRGKLLPSLTYGVFCSCWQDMFWEHTEMTQLIIPLQRRYRVGLISNIGELHWLWIAEQYPIFNQIEASLRILSFQAGVMKPDAGIFEQAVRQAQCAPDECVYVDDIDEYVLSGAAFGMQAIRRHSAEQVKTELQQRGVMW